MFATSTDLTVGLEEEFALLDPANARPRPALRGAARRRRRRDPGLRDAITGELISSEIEIISGRGEDIHDALAQPARAAPAALRARRARAGIALGSTGHAPVGGLPRAAEHRHRRTTAASSRGWATSRGATTRSRCTSTSACATPTAPCASATACARCCRCCSRPARARRFSKARTRCCTRCAAQTFTKSFPRCGVPDAYGSWAAFRDYLELLIATGLDRRVHAGLVVGAPARDVRHDRGAHRRRADHGGRVRRRSRR